MSSAIHGVRIVPLRRVVDERGAMLQMLRADDPHFDSFGEIYFSTVLPGVVKGWRVHHRMTLNLAVPIGAVRLALFDERATSPTRDLVMTIVIGEPNYQLVTVPPGVWSGFKALGGSTALVANCATIPHDPAEVVRCDPHVNHIPYDWSSAE